MKSVDKIILHGWGEIQPRKYISLKILQLRSIEAKYTVEAGDGGVH